MPDPPRTDRGPASGDDRATAAPDPLAGMAELDHDRADRRGYPEAVYCAGKTPDQVGTIAAQIVRRGMARRESRPPGTIGAPATLFTKAEPEHAAAVLAEAPGAAYLDTARLLAWPGEPPTPTGGLVVVAAAGTSDLPIAQEALHTARYLGRPAELVVDIGVAGLHRVLGRLELLRRARAVVVVAGMDGALPGVIAGLVQAPVVAVPTSVGYGAAFEGLAALLTMLNACSPGVAVVNIDNGFGAGYLAAQIAQP